MPFFNGATRADIPSGTLMLFQQTAAPTGWVKQTTHDNKALRVVSGAAGSGGSTAFTSVFTNQTVTTSISVSGSAAATTLSTSQIPSHWHRVSAGQPIPSMYSYDTIYGYPNGYDICAGPATRGATSEVQGGGGSHSHSISASGSGTSSAVTLNVQYVDLIIASKS